LILSLQLDKDFLEVEARVKTLEEEAGSAGRGETFKQMYEDTLTEVKEMEEDMEALSNLLASPECAGLSDAERTSREV